MGVEVEDARAPLASTSPLSLCLLAGAMSAWEHFPDPVKLAAHPDHVRRRNVNHTGKGDDACN